MWSRFDYGFRPYKSQAARKAEAKKYAEKLKKKGHVCCPALTTGRTIANSFWGKAWCQHMESFRDYENRLPRGRTYVRNGSVFDLQIKPGEVTALVSGSDIYEVTITLKPLAAKRWDAIRRRSSGQVASIVELLQGKFSDAVLRILTDPADGMFPEKREFTMDCSCPDGAAMCKHIAAVLYGIGCRLDQQPELFFTLRNVDPTELIAAAATGLTAATAASGSADTIAAGDLSDVFGVEIVSSDAPAPASVKPKPKRTRALAAKPGRSPQAAKASKKKSGGRKAAGSK